MLIISGIAFFILIIVSHYVAEKDDAYWDVTRNMHPGLKPIVAMAFFIRRVFFFLIDALRAQRK